MKKSFMFVLPILHLEKPEHQLLVAEQEKALRKEEFEMARHRLMVASRTVQDLKAKVHFEQKQLEHDRKIGIEIAMKYPGPSAPGISYILGKEANNG